MAFVYLSQSTGVLAVKPRLIADMVRREPCGGTPAPFLFLGREVGEPGPGQLACLGKAVSVRPVLLLEVGKLLPVELNDASPLAPVGIVSLLDSPGSVVVLGADLASRGLYFSILQVPCPRLVKSWKRVLGTYFCLPVTDLGEFISAAAAAAAAAACGSH